MARRLWDNLGTLLLALILGILVWVVALNEENPVETRPLSQTVVVDLVGKPDDMIILGSVISRTQVTVRAPRLVWERLSPRDVRVVADLAGLPPGTHTVPLQAEISADNARIEGLDPGAVTLTLERSDTREVPVEVEVTGVPAPGYEAGATRLGAEFATVSGPASAVASVADLSARVSIEGLKSDLRATIELRPVDAEGNFVNGVSVTPQTVQVVVPVAQREGYRDVAVKVVITGQVESGYQVTNITVAPSIITVASTNPALVEQMPGFVETQSLDLSGASDDVVRRLPLQLPAGVTVVGQQVVLVQVNIAAIEYSLTVERVLEMRGLPFGVSASASPETVDVLLLGPLTVLDGLSLQDVRVVLDLTGLGPGTYQVTPEVEVVPEGLRAENVLPGQVEVSIVLGTPTPTPTDEVAAAETEAALTATARPTPTPTRRPPTFTPEPTATPTPPAEPPGEETP
jgi:YbbR domain-containing protein